MILVASLYIITKLKYREADRKTSARRNRSIEVDSNDEVKQPAETEP